MKQYKDINDMTIDELINASGCIYDYFEKHYKNLTNKQYELLHTLQEIQTLIIKGSNKL